MSEIRFSCTKCGACCQDLGLPLTIGEAITWLEDNGTVEIYCEAEPWPREAPPAGDLRAAHRKRRSFPGWSGSSGIRVTAVLVATFSGACKNLGDDMRCAIYENRPLVCRIYPAEVSPFIQLNPATKDCPPEAWTSGNVIVSDDAVVNPHFLLSMEQSRQADQEDAPRKSLLCRHLQIDIAALAGEGIVSHRPGPDVFLDALRQARAADAIELQPQASWRFYSPALPTAKSLTAKGCRLAPFKRPGDSYSFLRAQTRRAGKSCTIAS